MALQILELLKMLPRTNCGDCGYLTCMAFATHVLREGVAPAACPHLIPRSLPGWKPSSKSRKRGA